MSMDFKELLKEMVARAGSDLYLIVDAPPSIKVHGNMEVLDRHRITKEVINLYTDELISREQLEAFNARPELNIAYSSPGLGRFRINIYRQRGERAMVVRHISDTLPTLSSMSLPSNLSELIMAKRGLILLVGATGTGKSTTLAALIQHRNQNEAGHIITIEDPVEYVYEHSKSIISQREVGVDTLSYAEALKNALRQAPDVIYIGEIRTQETMEQAIVFSETGHLCVSTLHANNANQALDRIINFFPEERKQQLLLDLSFNLKAIISQRLIPSVDGKRTPAVEILLGTPLVLDLIRRGEISELKDLMEKSENQGMQTFDQALEKLVKAGKITEEVAIANADSGNNLRIRLHQDTVPGATNPPKDGDDLMVLDD